MRVNWRVQEMADWTAAEVLAEVNRVVGPVKATVDFEGRDVKVTIVPEIPPPTPQIEQFLIDLAHSCIEGGYSFVGWRNIAGLHGDIWFDVPNGTMMIGVATELRNRW